MPKTYNTIGTFTSGAVLTAAQMNGIGTNVNNYRVPPICIARRNAAQSIANNTETSVSFDTEDVDTDGMFAPTSTNITIQTDGVYLLTGVVRLAATVDGLLVCRIKVGGTTYAEQRFQVSGGANLLDTMTLSVARSLVATNVCTMTILQNNGGSAARNTASITQLAVAWLGQAS